MFKLLKKETHNPGSVQAISKINPQYQNRRYVSFSYFHFTIFYHLLYQLVDLFHDFLIRNRYSQQYIDFIIPKGTLDKRIPVKKPWDHAINLREDFVPKKGKIYLMLREEKEEVKEFVEE